MQLGRALCGVGNVLLHGKGPSGVAAAAAVRVGAVGGGAAFVPSSSFHSSRSVSFGFEEFSEPTKSKPTDVFVSGRSWTVSDLRRKNFDDLHKLWYVLYKERNLLLSEREKSRRGQRPVSRLDENRYIKVKRSMAGIKHVLKERSKIKKILKESEGFVSADKTQQESVGGKEK